MKILRFIAQAMFFCLFILCSYGIFFSFVLSHSAFTQTELLDQLDQINKMEIEAGELAQKKGSNKLIQRFGDRLARDHRLAQKMVLDFSKRHQISIPSESLSSDESPQKLSHRIQLDHLSGLTGVEFDQGFLEMMENGHVEAINSLTRAQEDLPRHLEITQLLNKLIPILRQHHLLSILLREKIETVQSTEG